MLGKTLSEILFADIEQLLADEVNESHTLEYKGEVNLDNRSGRKELCRDITALANSSGGDLLLGIREDQGVPVEITGVDVADEDAFKLNVESLLRDSVHPQLPESTVTFGFVRDDSERCVVLIRIRSSLLRPHQATSGLTDFYARHSAGKYPLDVENLRSAFLQAATSGAQLRSFREARLGDIAAGSTPVPLLDGPKLVIHMLPFSMLAQVPQIDPRVLYPHRRKLDIHNEYVGSYRFNFDGYLALGVKADRSGSESSGHRYYVQVFRNGAIEIVDSNISKKDELFLTDIERETLKAVRDQLSLYEHLNVEMPLFAAISLVGAKGYGVRMNAIGELFPVDRDVLPALEVLIESFADDVAKALRPTFDTFWQAVGQDQSPYYNEQDEWIG